MAMDANSICMIEEKASILDVPVTAVWMAESEPRIVLTLTHAGAVTVPSYTRSL